MDIFDRKGIKPMLLTEDHTPTDSSDYICELKLDGIRCLTYLSNHTDLRNKRDIPLIAAFPEWNTVAFALFSFLQPVHFFALA